MQGASQHWLTVYWKSTSRWPARVQAEEWAGGTRAETEFGMQTRGEARRASMVGGTGAAPPS